MHVDDPEVTAYGILKRRLSFLAGPHFPVTQSAGFLLEPLRQQDRVHFGVGGH